MTRTRPSSAPQGINWKTCRDIAKQATDGGWSPYEAESWETKVQEASEKANRLIFSRVQKRDF